MIRYLVFLVLLGGFCRAAEPKPILVVLERNPWLSVIGSDSPTFALYDDGTLFYLREKATSDEPFQVRRVPNAKDQVSELLGFDLARRQEHYELSAATDQVTTVIWTPVKQIEIYGNWRKTPETTGASDPRLKAIAEQERKRQATLPAEIRAALLRLDQERAKEGQAWFPPTVEVMFWPYEHAPEASIVWPEDWPGLAARDTRKRGDSFSVFLPSGQLPALRKFLALRKERGAVLINGRKMSAAIRFPFPGEAAWMR